MRAASRINLFLLILLAVCVAPLCLLIAVVREIGASWDERREIEFWASGRRWPDDE